MPDLHEWITQQIDEREQLVNLISPGGYAPDEWRIEPSRSGRWARLVAYSRTNIEPPEAAVREDDQPVALVQTGRNEHLLMAMHDPAGVLRRCAADRKILADHAPMGVSWSNYYACEGCGYDGADYCSEPNVGHVNDCPTLLATAGAYGLTEGQRAALDRPEKEQPAPSQSVIPPIIQEHMTALTERILGTRLAEPRLLVKVVGPAPIPMPEWLREDLGLPAPDPEPTPDDRAFAVVEPHLSALALYKPDTNPEA